LKVTLDAQERGLQDQRQQLSELERTLKQEQLTLAAAAQEQKADLENQLHEIAAAREKLAGQEQEWRAQKEVTLREQSVREAEMLARVAATRAAELKRQAGVQADLDQERVWLAQQKQEFEDARAASDQSHQQQVVELRVKERVYQEQVADFNHRQSAARIAEAQFTADLEDGRAQLRREKDAFAEERRETQRGLDARQAALAHAKQNVDRLKQELDLQDEAAQERHRAKESELQVMEAQLDRDKKSLAEKEAAFSKQQIEFSEYTVATRQKLDAQRAQLEVDKTSFLQEKERFNLHMQEEAARFQRDEAQRRDALNALDAQLRQASAAEKKQLEADRRRLQVLFFLKKPFNYMIGPSRFTICVYFPVQPLCCLD
jgi:hypothetical protein